MANTLKNSFAAYNATPINIRWDTLASCPDGSLAAVLWDDEFSLSKRDGILSHVSKVSEWQGTVDAAGDRRWFALLPDALANQTPIRLIIAHRAPRDFTPRPEFVGKVVLWDGEHLQIDFVKREA